MTRKTSPAALGIARLMILLPLLVLVNLIFFPVDSFFSDDAIREQNQHPSVISAYTKSIPKETTFVEQQVANPRTIDTNQPIFVCGWNRGRLAELLFPEFNGTVGLGLEPEKHNNQSLAFFGTGGRCQGERLNHTWFHENWKGTALMVNGEGIWGPDARGANTYQIGVLPDSNRSVHVLFLAMALVGHYPSELWPFIFNPNKKKRSRKSSFLLYTNSNCVDFREQAADRLAEINPPAHGGGHCRGRSKNSSLIKKLPRNQARAKGPREAGWSTNMNLFGSYKFCLVMENAALFGYITEKILNAFLAGCIPIYYGTEEIFQVFNRKAFVYYNISDPQPALDLVRHLEYNETAYDEVQNQVILADGENTINEFFSLADSIGDGSLKRKLRKLLGLHG